MNFLTIYRLHVAGSLVTGTLVALTLVALTLVALTLCEEALLVVLLVDEALFGRKLVAGLCCWVTG